MLMSFLVDTPQAHLQCITICGYVISQFCLLVNRYTELLHIFSECYLIEPNLLKACASPISHGIIGNFCNFLLVICAIFGQFLKDIFLRDQKSFIYHGLLSFLLNIKVLLECDDHSAAWHFYS